MVRNDEQATLLPRLLAGELSQQQVAAQLGVSEPQLAALRAAYLQGLVAAADRRASARPRRGRWLVAAAALGLVTAFGVSLGVAPLVYAQSCSGTWNELNNFCAGDRADAEAVNENFRTLRDWLFSKVGAEASATISSDKIESAGVALALNTTGKDDVTLVNTANLAEEVSSGVFDDGTSDSPYGRINSDSFHTNGLGEGQIWIEGDAIDANGPIRVGLGNAGGQSARTTQVSSLSWTGHLNSITIGAEVPLNFNRNSPSISLGVTTDYGVCFLTRVQANDLDDQGDDFYCRVVDNSGTWQLTANGGGSDGQCAARCITW